jgi:hypothetical protein
LRARRTHGESTRFQYRNSVGIGSDTNWFQIVV